MTAWVGAGVFALAAVGAALVAGCTADASGGSYSSGGGGGYGGSSSGPPPSSSCPSASVQEMLVDVDPNQTMTANPGDGVGVFTEYQSGGHWHVWWTCDTNKTALPCSFDVTVSVNTGSIANPTAQAIGRGDSLVQTGTQQLEAITNTTTSVAGMTFDTPIESGARPIITLDAKLSGQECGSWPFFVQKGAINGGYGAVSDPLMLEPLAP